MPQPKVEQLKHAREFAYVAALSGITSAGLPPEGGPPSDGEALPDLPSPESALSCPRFTADAFAPIVLTVCGY